MSPSSSWRLPEPGLAAAALTGGERELDALCAAWLPHLYRWCHRLGGPRIDAEDAAHDALILVCRRLPRVDGPDRFPAFLYGVARRVIANHRRRAWFKRWIPGPVPSLARAEGHGSVEAVEAAATVRAVLETLPWEHREVLILCELEEHSAHEAAALLGIPDGTVKSRLRAARTSFRSELERRRPVDRLAVEVA